MLGSIDTLRQIQGDGLSWLGLGPTECRYRIVASGARRRLRAYAGANTGLPLLIVAAPIMRPYIWDLADCVSVVRHCLQNRLGLYLLEWMPPPLHGGTDAGLADYSQSIGEAVAATARGAGAKVPFNGPFARRDARGDPRSVGPAAHPGARAVVDAAVLCARQLPVSRSACRDDAREPIHNRRPARLAVVFPRRRGGSGDLFVVAARRYCPQHRRSASIDGPRPGRALGAG